MFSVTRVKMSAASLNTENGDGNLKF